MLNVTRTSPSHIYFPPSHSHLNNLKSVKSYIKPQKTNKKPYKRTYIETNIYILQFSASGFVSHLFSMYLYNPQNVANKKNEITLIAFKNQYTTKYTPHLIPIESLKRTKLYFRYI